MARNKNHPSTERKGSADLTQGSVVKGILAFALPLFIGQLLQQLYSTADAWVIGNFADNNSFAAVSSAGSLMFLIIGFFNGIAVGGGVVISRYFGAKEPANVRRAVHTNVLMGILASVLSTVAGVLFTPTILGWMQTPAEVLPEALTYTRIYFAGVSTVVMYNIFMSIMRAMGDSVHPLYYLILSSVVNVVLDLLFVAVFGWGVAGAAVATVFSQGISAVMCFVRMRRAKDETRIEAHLLKFDASLMREVLVQGLPSGLQNSVISIGNMVVQSNVNAFGAYAMSGQGAYARIEGFVFLPIMCMAMALPTFISQNLGAREYKRAKQGAVFGIAFGAVMAEAIGLAVYLMGEGMLRLFVQDAEALRFGEIHTQIIPLFYFLLAFSHCAAGVLRGCGKSVVPMATMLSFWCGVRIVWVTQALKVWPVYSTITWAYPLTWACSSVTFLIFLLTSDWTHAFERRRALGHA